MQQILKADKLIGVFQVPFKKLAGVYFCFLFFFKPGTTRLRVF